MLDKGIQAQHNIFGEVDYQLTATPPEPFIKWMGGKRRLYAKILGIMPAVVQDYYEPCVGGGSMFYMMYDKIYADSHLYDANPRLINAYIQVRDNLEALKPHLREYTAKFLEDRDWYYEARTLIDEGDLAQQAAMFIFLNKSCFNGQYAVNKKGEFNVSIGHDLPVVKGEDRAFEYVYNEPQLMAASKALQTAMTIKCQNLFDLDLMTMMKDDLIYIDPPYDATWDRYNPYRFTSEHQEHLMELSNKARHLGVNVIVSNNDTDFIRDLYKDTSLFTIIPIKSMQRINTAGGKDPEVDEVIITNYEVQK